MLSDLSEKELSSAVEVYRHAYGDTISEAEAFEEMCCDALGKINIFAGTEHDSANYGKVQESFRRHTAETANKGRAPPKGGVKYSYEGKNKDGIEVYETSSEVMNLSIAERNKHFLQLMKEKYRGRTAKFVRNGHAYYATFELEDVNKNIYGDARSDKKGKKAKVRTGADGNIFELVENSHYNGSKPEHGKKSKPHKGIEYWDYFIKTVQIDNSIYDLVANVRKNKSNQYVYGIQLRENKKIKASPAVGSQNVSLSSAANTSKSSIRNSGENVKKYSAEPTEEAKANVNSYSREPESITELHRQNERLHIDAEKAAALYSGARVTVPKMSNKSNGYIQREF